VGNFHDLLKSEHSRSQGRRWRPQLAARYGIQAPRVDDQGCPRSLGHRVLSGSAVDETLCERLDLLIVPMSIATRRRDIYGDSMLSAQAYSQKRYQGATLVLSAFGRGSRERTRSRTYGRSWPAWRAIRRRLSTRPCGISGELRLVMGGPPGARWSRILFSRCDAGVISTARTRSRTRSPRPTKYSVRLGGQP
jgi:hypothetical protein